MFTHHRFASIDSVSSRYYSPGYADELLERVENHANKA